MKSRIAIFVAVILIAVGAAAAVYKFYYSKQPNMSNPKISASVSELKKSEATAKSLKSLKFDNPQDYQTLSQAIASIPRNDLTHEFDN